MDNQPSGFREMYTFEQALGLTPHNGWLEPEEAKLLWDSVSKTEGDILEVGSYFGRSTVLLACTGRTVYAVDPFENFDTQYPSGDYIHDQLVLNLRKRRLGNVVIYRQRIEDWKLLQVGFAYLDGDHTYNGTLRQIGVAIMAGATEVCIHDYENAGDGREVVRAVNDSGIKVVEIAGRMAHCEIR